MAQLVSQRLGDAWEKKEFSSISSPEEMMRRVGTLIGELLDPFLRSANHLRPLGIDPAGSLCKSLLAIPVKNRAHLLSFDYNGAPERATPDLPFIAMGSGQAIADPFLAFLKRLLWSTSPPSLPEARLAAAWTIDHVRRTNPGGVGGHTQLAVLAPSGGSLAVNMSSGDDIQEHMEKVELAERALVEEVRGTRARDVAGPVPALPPTAGD
jgi:hypothetical protein